MKMSVEDESYWNRTSSKAFCFDDDDSGGGLDASVKWDAILNDDAISEASFDNAPASALNLSIKSVISDDALKVLLQEQTLDDRLLSKGMSAEEELKLLRRQIQTTLYNPSSEATAYKLLLGKIVSFEVFHSLAEKKELLDVVLQNGGGDAVIGVSLFLKKSLNRANFHKLLLARPKAMQHYITYLKQRQMTNEVVELLQLLHRKEEAVLIQFQAAHDCQDLQRCKQKIRQLIEHYSGKDELVSLYQQTFHSSLKLLELVEKERNALDNHIDQNSTPIEVLYACCRKHHNWKDQDLLRTTSPFRLCAEQQITAAQFEWTALNERSLAQAYVDLESVFERVPTWHPMKQKQFHISFSLAVAIDRLYALQAPPTVLYLFLSKMNNSTEKLALARRVKCVRGVIDALAGLKDINQLTQLRDSLPERSEEQFYCEKALKALQTKRWSTDNINLKLKL